MPLPLFFDNEIQSHSLRPSPQVQIHQESVTPPPLNFDDEVPSTSHLGKWKEREGETTDAERESDPDDEEWEAELNDSLTPATTEIQDWAGLQWVKKFQGSGMINWMDLVFEG